MTFYDCLSGRKITCSHEIISEMCQQINKYLLSIGQVTINNVYSLLGIPGIASGDSIGWELSDLRNGFDRISVTIGHRDPHQSIGGIYFDPEPHNLFTGLAVEIPQRSGKTLCDEAMKYIHEQCGFENRKENNMGPEKKTTGVIFAAASDPRGLRTIELKIKKVIFNDPATIVFWSDGTKTVVKCGENDVFDPEKGLAMAISKKVLGNNYKAYGRFKKWLPKEYSKVGEAGKRLTKALNDADDILEDLHEARERLTKAFDDYDETVKRYGEDATSEK